MSGMLCPHCGKTMDIFGPSQAEAVSLETGLPPLIGTLPLDPEISRLGDKGAIDQYAVNIFKSIPSLIEDSVNKKRKGGRYNMKLAICAQGEGPDVPIDRRFGRSPFL